MVKRIGIAGAAGAGKTDAAEYLRDVHNFKILGFATPLYKLGDIHNTPSIQWHSRVYGWTQDYLKPLGYSDSECWWFTYQSLDVMDDTPVKKGKNRTLLQLIGTEVGRELDENLWTNIFEHKADSDSGSIVNDNLRFPNEFDSLDRLNFVTLYLDVPLEIRAERYEKKYGTPMSKEQLSHSSEAHLDTIKNKVDVVYVNTGTLDDLKSYLDNLVNNSVPDRVTVGSLEA